MQSRAKKLQLSEESEVPEEMTLNEKGGDTDQFAFIPEEYDEKMVFGMIREMFPPKILPVESLKNGSG